MQGAQRLQRGGRVRDSAVLAHLRSLARFRKRHRDGAFVHVMAGVDDIVLLTPSPQSENQSSRGSDAASTAG